jgi:hypothetical protein
MNSMDQIEQNSYSYYHIHQKIALVSLLTTEMRKSQQQQQQEFSHISPKKFLGINLNSLQQIVIDFLIFYLFRFIFMRQLELCK